MILDVTVICASAHMQERDHLAFICRLRDFMPREAVIEGVERALSAAGFLTEEVTLEEASRVAELEHIRNTCTIDL